MKRNYCVTVHRGQSLIVASEHVDYLNTTSPSTTNYYRLVAFFCRLCPRKLSTFLFRVGVCLFVYMALWECVLCNYLCCYSVRWCASLYVYGFVGVCSV